MIIRVKKLLSLRARLLRHGENKQGDCGTAVGVHAGVCIRVLEREMCNY